jgi:hypothetical protein
MATRSAILPASLEPEPKVVTLATQARVAADVDST